jgi:wobble nucleotide-excising tRNase
MSRALSRCAEVWDERESHCRFVLFDNPIQSMDDNRTEAFKKTVIRRLLNSGFQVFLLTHMDTLAGDVERLCRSSSPGLYKMEAYTLSGPNIVRESNGLIVVSN